MHRIEKLILKVLKQRFSNTITTNDTSASMESEATINRVSFSYSRLGGKFYLKYYLNIVHKNIENKWLHYRDPLGFHTDLIPITIWLDLYDGYEDFHLDGFGLDWQKLLKHKDEETLINNLIDDTIELFDKYSILNEVDTLLNRTDNVIECLRYTEQTGLPFRKVLIARTVNNPRAAEIENNMRNFCQLTYSIGVENNDEIDKSYLYVFEELFGK